MVCLTSAALTNNKILSDDFFDRKEELQRTAFKNKLVTGVE
jgi:hypothetical protein